MERSGSVCVHDEGWISIQNDPSLASVDTTPSPHGRITAPRLVVAFAHMHGEAGTPALGIWSAVVGRKGPGSVCMQKGWISMQIDPIHPRLSRHHPNPSPHRRITAPRLVVAFAHMHGEAGTPALGIWSALAGRKGPVLCVCRRGGFTYYFHHAKRPHPRIIRHPPVSAQANHYT